MSLHRVDGAIESLMDAGWQVRDDLDVIEHGMQRLVVRIMGLRPLFDDVAEGRLDRPVLEVVGELLEQFKHNIPEGGSELDRLCASVPLDQYAEVELMLERVHTQHGDQRVDGWAMIVL